MFIVMAEVATGIECIAQMQRHLYRESRGAYDVATGFECIEQMQPHILTRESAV